MTDELERLRAERDELRALARDHMDKVMGSGPVA